MKKRAWYKEMACASSICVKYGGTAVLGAEGVPLRGPGVRKVIKKTIEKADGADAVISKKPDARPTK